MSRTRKQHYIPIFYLRNFACKSKKTYKEPFVWVYDIENESKSIIRSYKKSPKNLCHQTDLYTINIDKKYKDQVENFVVNNGGLTLGEVLSEDEKGIYLFINESVYSRNESDVSKIIRDIINERNFTLNDEKRN